MKEEEKDAEDHMENKNKKGYKRRNRGQTKYVKKMK